MSDQDKLNSYYGNFVRKYRGPDDPAQFKDIIKKLSFGCWNMKRNTGLNLQRLQTETSNGGKVVVTRVENTEFVDTFAGGKENYFYIKIYSDNDLTTPIGDELDSGKLPNFKIVQWLGIIGENGVVNINPWNENSYYKYKLKSDGSGVERMKDKNGNDIPIYNPITGFWEFDAYTDTATAPITTKAKISVNCLNTINGILDGSVLGEIKYRVLNKEEKAAKKWPRFIAAGWPAIPDEKLLASPGRIIFPVPYWEQFTTFPDWFQPVGTNQAYVDISVSSTLYTHGIKASIPYTIDWLTTQEPAFHSSPYITDGDINNVVTVMDLFPIGAWQTEEIPGAILVGDEFPDNYYVPSQSPKAWLDNLSGFTGGAQSRELRTGWDSLGTSIYSQILTKYQIAADLSGTLYYAHPVKEFVYRYHKWENIGDGNITLDIPVKKWMPEGEILVLKYRIYNLVPVPLTVAQAQQYYALSFSNIELNYEYCLWHLGESPPNK